MNKKIKITEEHTLNVSKILQNEKISDKNLIDYVAKKSLRRLQTANGCNITDWPRYTNQRKVVRSKSQKYYLINSSCGLCPRTC